MGEVNHTARKHAILSASGSSRWLNCPPSAKLEAELPDSTSIYAQEGTLAHELCDLDVKLYIGEITKRSHSAQVRKLTKEPLYNVEMEGYARDYLDYIISKVKSKDSVILAETQIDFSEYVPDGFGTVDCIIIQDNTLTIIDYKYGKGVAVSAQNNSQMKLYALGAIEMFGHIYDFSEVEMCIYQPRIDNIDESVETVDELITWGNEVVKPVAQLAIEGKGEFKAGNHCTFCKLRAKCKKLSEHCLEVIKEDFNNASGNPDTSWLMEEDIAMILERAKLIKNWLADVEEYAVNGMLDGEFEVPGYKVVEGKSIRKYRDQDKVVEVLVENGFDESVLFEKSLLPLSKMEKFVGKKKFAEILGDHIEKPRGKPTLAPLTDKRPVFVKDNDFEVVED